MSYGLFVAATGAEVQNRRVQMISHNLANVSTPGFKRELPIVQARPSESIERGLVSSDATTPENVGGGVRLEESVTEFGLGQFRQTGVETDLALESPHAFFAVQRGDQTLLTRAGNFSPGPDGLLRTPHGDLLLSEGGEPISLRPGQPFVFSAAGTLDQGGERVPLAIVQPRSLGDLVRVGDNLFSPLAEPQPVELQQRGVRSGYLEMSAVEPTREMVEMIHASRAFEANVKMIQHQDQIVGTLVNRVLSQR